MAFGILFVFAATSAWAQRDVPRVEVFGSAGYGALADDEGGLGGGGAVGGGAGWLVSDRIVLEAAVMAMRHEQEGSLSWRGRPLMVGGRARVRFGGAGASIRPFAGGGAGFLRYTGTFSESVFAGPGAPPTIVPREWAVSGLVLEGGGGVEIAIGRMLFVRPEAWLAIASPRRVPPAPEPPYSMPRVLLSAGARF